LEAIEELVTDGEIAKQIIEASKTSMGQGLSEIDQVIIFDRHYLLNKRILGLFKLILMGSFGSSISNPIPINTL
jgi:hypothetical protein